MSDLDVNDDGLVDVIFPTRPCWPSGLTPIPEHGPHTFTDFGLPPTVWLCRGYPVPEVPSVTR